MKEHTPELDEALLSVAQLASVLGCSTVTVMARVGKGLLPKPVKIGGGAIRWFKTDVMDHLRRQARAK